MYPKHPFFKVHFVAKVWVDTTTKRWLMICPLSRVLFSYKYALGCNVHITTLDDFTTYMCVFSSHLFWTSRSLDVSAGVTQEEGVTENSDNGHHI